MAIKTLLIHILTLLLVSVVSVFGQFEQKVDDMLNQKVTMPKTVRQDSNPATSEMQSAVAAPSTPLTLTGIANGFSTMGLYCNGSSKVYLGYSDGTISWYNLPSGVNLNNYNCLTITFSSLPPGPTNFKFYGSGTSASDSVPLDSTLVVLDKAKYPTFFPSSYQFLGVQLAQANSWSTSDVSCPKANAIPTDWPLDKPYPGLQWAPDVVMFVYQ